MKKGLEIPSWGKMKTHYRDKPNFGSSHFLFHLAIQEMIPGSRVLDIGVGGGIAARLGNERGLSLFGIEPNSEWAKDIKNHYSEIFIGMLDETPDEFLQNFDNVLLLDALEHMADPMCALRRVVDFQNQNTTFFISVPNIANIWIRLNLLFGRFEYTQTGILDKTHLRFFTKESFITMLKKSGLEIIEITPTPVPLDILNPMFKPNNPGYPIYLSLYWMTQIFPTLLGYQFFCQAKKRS